MGVELRKGRSGEWRPHWYGRLWEGTRSRVVNLAVPVRGTPPRKLADTGDREFEASRDQAAEAFRKVAEEAAQKGRAEHLLERLIVAKTGRPTQHARIDELAARWLSMPRAKVPTAAYVSGCRSACARFVAVMGRRRPTAAYLYEVTAEDAGAFVTDLRANFAPRTCRGYTGLLRSAFARFLPAGYANPFADLVGRHTAEAAGGGSVHRRPFTPEELSAILAAAREYDGGALFGPVVASACTALRRGDACRLAWESIDLAAGAVTVRTSKTGETVDLPLLAPLRAVLAAIDGPRKGPCFPAAARMLADNPDGLTWRFKTIVARALGGATGGDADAGELPPDPAAIEAAGRAAIEGLQPGPRRDRMTEAFSRYVAGESLPTIAASMGVSKGSVSGWLSAVSGMIGRPVVRGVAPSVRAGIARHTQAARATGQRAASIYDWHALRTTYVTLALSAGVPIELVRRVTGHRTVEVVLSNYFRPGRETLRAAMSAALPAVLTGGDLTPGPVAELQTLVAKVAAGSATEKDRRRLRMLAAKV